MFEHSRHRPSGTLITTDLASGRETHQDTVQCGHCGAHWVYVKGSGRVRGFCTLCSKMTCGPRCPRGAGCVEQERWCENVEAGRDPNHRPVTVSFAGCTQTAAGIWVPPGVNDG
jgi:hypothetical protein